MLLPGALAGEGGAWQPSSIFGGRCGVRVSTPKKKQKNNSLEDPLFVTLAFLPVEQGAVALVSSMR